MARSGRSRPPHVNDEPRPIVLDASTALAAVLPDEDWKFARAAAATALTDGLIVPGLWQYEVQNGLVLARRRKRIDAREQHDALRVLRGFEADVRTPHGLGLELSLAERYALTTYDAAYLAVAIEAHAVLATSDRRLQAAADAAGVKLFRN